MNTKTSPIKIIEHTRPGQYIDTLAYKVQKALGGKIHKSGAIYLKEELYKKFQNNINNRLEKSQLYYIQLNYKDASQTALILQEKSKSEILGTRIVRDSNLKKSEYNFKNKKENTIIRKILSNLSVNRN